MMVFKSEIAIDIDDNRRIWISAEAITEEGEDPTDCAPAVIAALTKHVTEEGLSAYERTEARAVISGPLAGSQPPPVDPTRPRPEHPETMKAFGE